jgi:heme/copper-type cytochrome/quinol oxidase subunit 3
MEIPYEVKPRRDTGLYNAKLGVWLFLASEVMLFGGLFSAYVFLRTGVQDGVDNPWPWGLNVHKGFVWLGFLNTLVLIASSVGVVFAWVALKERNWRKYQIYMYFVVACALVFMCVKGVEYNSKLNKHHGIKLVDNSVMEGAILDKTDRIRFEGTRAVFGLQGAHPAFLNDISDEKFPTFTATVQFKEDEEPIVTEISSESQLKKWFTQHRRIAARKLTAERTRYRKELESGNAKPVNLNTSATLVSSEPFNVNAKPTKVVGHSDTSVNYRDGSKVEGKLISDDVKFVMHEVDLQLVLPQKQRDSLVWDVIGDDHAKKQFFAKQQEEYNKMRDYYEGRGETIPDKMLRGHMLNLHYIDHEDHGHDGDHGDDPHKSEAKHSASGGDGEHHDYITVPRDKIKFMGNHGPRYGNYYALYFTMTALHGLHVVGGALVLLFFTVFGKKLYLKNPEHLANRVEVGGLFWHFVDLIWIFLFPLMYLL